MCDHPADQMMDVIGVEINKIYQDISLGSLKQLDDIVGKVAGLSSTEVKGLQNLNKVFKKGNLVY